MNLKDKIKAVRAIFELNTVEEVMEAKHIKTIDGLILSINSGLFEIDQEIVAIDEAGVEQPVIDGDYNLEDGTVITVTGGKIAEIATPEAEVVEEEMATDIEEVPVVETPTVEVIETPVNEEVDLLNKRIKELEALIANKDKEIKMSKEAFEKLKSEPAAPALDTRKFEKTEVKTNKTNSMLSKVTEIINKK